MDPRSQLQVLAQLADIDQASSLLRGKLASVPSGANKAQAASDAARGEHDALAQQRVLLDKEKKQLEAEIGEDRFKLKRWESRANEIKGEREYGALVSEIGATKRMISRREERIFEIMAALEESDKKSATARSKQETHGAEASAEFARVSADVAEMQAKVASLEATRVSLLGQLPIAVSKRYRVVADKRQGVGVAVIRGDVCSACQRTLPPNFVVGQKKGATVEACPSCMRLLVHEIFLTAQAPEA